MRRTCCTIAALVLSACVFGASRAEAGQASPIYRVFLKDGRVLASYGEYADLGDRLVFTVPIGDIRLGALPLVSVPIATVDLARTNRYRDALRAANYAATRGPAEYDAVVATVSRAIAGISGTADPRQRLAMAQAGRQALVDWTRTSYGYRAKDVDDLLAMLDDIIRQVSAAAGAPIAIDLVAGAPSAPTEPLLPAPTLRESIAIALETAAVVASGPQRIAVLRAAVSAAHAAAGGSGAPDPDLVARAERELAEEVAVEHEYANLVAEATATGASAAHAGDLVAAMAVKARVLVRDQQLGGRRPAEVTALLVTMDRDLAAAEARRTALDAWQAARPAIEAYRRQASTLLSSAKSVASILASIRGMARPPESALVRADRRLSALQASLAALSAPAGLRDVQGLIASALQFAREACAARQRATVGDDAAMARDASSAAMGAQLLLDRARTALAAAAGGPPTHGA